MTVKILPSALEDLADGFEFYEEREPGLGLYFFDSLDAEIDSLRKTAGIHSIHFGRFHRHLASRFPFAIYYTVEEDTVYVRAVLDCRRDPQWIRSRLK